MAFNLIHKAVATSSVGKIFCLSQDPSLYCISCQFKAGKLPRHELVRSIAPSALPNPSQKFKAVVQATFNAGGPVRIIVSDEGRDAAHQFWNLSYPESGAAKGSQVVLFLFSKEYSGDMHAHKADSISAALHCGENRRLVETQYGVPTFRLNARALSEGRQLIRDNTSDTVVATGEYHKVEISAINPMGLVQLEMPILAKQWLEKIGFSETDIKANSQNMVVLLHVYGIAGVHPNRDR